jgi:hypothetical protein
VTLLVRHTDVLGGYEVGKGGGIIGGFNPYNPFRGWRTYAVAASYVDPDGLEFPVIRFRKTGGPITDTIAQVQSRVTSLFVEKTWPMGGGLLRGVYPSLGWYVLDPSTLAEVAGPLTPVGNVALGNLSQETRERTPLTDHVLQWFEHTLPTGPYILALVSNEPTVEHPVWVSGHPVEIITDRMTKKGEAYDTASATACMASMGSMFQHQMAVTDADQTPQELIDTLGEAYGFTVRRSVTNGKAEFKHWRKKVQTAPAITIEDTHLRQDGGPTFDLVDSSRVTRVRVTGELISVWQSGLAQRLEKTINTAFKGFGRAISPKKRQRAIAKAAYQDSEKPASGLIVTSADFTFNYSSDGVTPDSELYGEQEVEIALNGMPAVTNGTAGGSSPLNLEQWAEGAARLIFSPSSRGRQMARVRTLRGTPAEGALLGEEVTLDLPWLPNAQLGQSPTSQRGGSRPFRVVEYTPELLGPDLLLADEGTGVQYDVVPDLTVVEDSANPGMWLVTVNNASELTADGAQVEFQCKVFGPLETPDFTDPGFRYTVDDSTTWPDDPMVIRMGPFPLGHEVHFRASAWLFDSAASDWSDWDGVAGGGVAGGISSLVVGTPTTSGVALSWTNTNTTAPVRVQIKRDTESVYGTVVDLPAGSTSYSLTGLIPETDYDARVVLVVDGTEVGSALTDSFTTDLAANQTQLNTPTNAQVFGGWNAVTGVSSPGTYGLEVMAVFGPPEMQIVFEEAVETAVGSGTPGAYTEVLTTPAVVGGVTRYQANAANDGKLRYLRAYAQASGYDDSDTTTALSVNPWPATPTVPDPPSLTIGGMVPTHILSGESFTVPVRRQALFTVPIDIEGVLIVDGVLEAVN